MDNLKAWKVSPINAFYSYVVFTETRGKARAYAQGLDGFEECAFTDIEVHRLKKADCMCNGRKEMDWQNENDRLFLVKEYGWYCGDDIDYDECKVCSANKYCEPYLDCIKEQEVSLDEQVCRS